MRNPADRYRDLEEVEVTWEQFSRVTSKEFWGIDSVFDWKAIRKFLGLKGSDPIMLKPVSCSNR